MVSKPDPVTLGRVRVENVSFTSEWVTLRIKPDRDKAYTRVEWRGTRKADKEPVRLRLSDGSLRPLWTQTQEENYAKAKRNKSLATGKIVGAGVGAAPDGVNRPYFDVAAGLYDPDDFRGAVATNDDGHLRFVVTHTSTRFWLTAPAWGGGTPPSVGSFYTVSLVDKRSIAELSAQGVGRGFYWNPEHVCGVGVASGLIAENLRQHGFCGRALASTRATDGNTHTEEYQYTVRVPSAAQREAGWCEPTIRLSEKPKPSVGHIGYPPPAGGSPPSGVCRPGNSNRPSQIALVDVEIEVPVREDAAAYFAEPPDVDGRPAFRGPAYSDDPATWDGAGEPYGED